MSISVSLDIFFPRMTPKRKTLKLPEPEVHFAQSLQAHFMEHTDWTATLLGELTRHTHCNQYFLTIKPNLYHNDILETKKKNEETLPSNLVRQDWYCRMPYPASGQNTSKLLDNSKEKHFNYFNFEEVCAS